MFGTNLKKRLIDVEREVAYQAEKIKLLQEQCERIERRCSVQAKDFDNQLKQIIKLLEKDNAQSSLGSTEDKKEASYSQIIDEWLNGKKEDK